MPECCRKINFISKPVWQDTQLHLRKRSRRLEALSRSGGKPRSWELTLVCDLRDGFLPVRQGQKLGWPHWASGGQSASRSPGQLRDQKGAEEGDCVTVAGGGGGFVS